MKERETLSSDIPSADGDGYDDLGDPVGKKREPSDPPPMEWLQYGFRIRSFTFRRGSSMALEAVIERLIDLRERIEFALKILGQYQGGFPDSLNAWEFDFEAAFQRQFADVPSPDVTHAD
jgi:hypothetical protein